MKKIGVLRFLGTNCDDDILEAVNEVGCQGEYVWWADHFDPSSYDGFVVPGGFSYGDYLRAGALAAQSPAMVDLKKAAEKEIPILGICNGFQILCESGLLPGALATNNSQRFQEQWVDLTEVGRCFWSGAEKYKMPMAHSTGRFIALPDTLKKLQDNDQIWVTYDSNPNGSMKDIAGISSENHKTAALMPHPERAMYPWMGSDMGRKVFEVLV